MKALSIRQPWAWLIVNGHKDIESRTWSTKFRGQFYIHTGKTFDLAGYHRAIQIVPNMPALSAFQKGGIVGVAELIDVVTESESNWFDGPVGFVLQNAKPLPYLPMPGQLGFFNVNFGGST